MATSAQSTTGGNVLQHLIGLLLRDADGSPRSLGAIAGIVALPLVVFLVNKLLFPTVDPREPPILRPRVPVFGHVYSLMRETGVYYSRL